MAGNAGKYTVPVLWDKKKNTIVNNESADIVRMLNDRMNKLAKNVSLTWPRQLPSKPCCACDG
jgi:glutathionyl-hydroquinone reductase